MCVDSCVRACLCQTRCGQCAASHRFRTGCRAKDEIEFCQAVAPPTPGKPACHDVLTQLCGPQHDTSGMFKCVACAGANSAEVLGLANCTNSVRCMMDPHLPSFTGSVSH